MLRNVLNFCTTSPPKHESGVSVSPLESAFVRKRSPHLRTTNEMWIKRLMWRESRSFCRGKCGGRSLSSSLLSQTAELCNENTNVSRHADVTAQVSSAHRAYQMVSAYSLYPEAAGSECSPQQSSGWGRSSLKENCSKNSRNLKTRNFIIIFGPKINFD